MKHHPKALAPEELRRGRAPDKSAVARSIEHAVTVKDGAVFVVSDPDGEIPMEGAHGLGLYADDCRYLSGLTVRVADETLTLLGAAEGEPSHTAIGLTTPALDLEDERVHPRRIVLRRERSVDGVARRVVETLVFTNTAMTCVTIPVRIAFRAEFEDTYTVRQGGGKAPGVVHPPHWNGHTLECRYDGRDGVERSLTIRFDPEPTREYGAACFELELRPREPVRVTAELQLSPAPPGPSEMDGAVRVLDADFPQDHARVSSDSPLLNRALDRSLEDLRGLRTKWDGSYYYSAGLPWYGALFGRDSVITALETLAFGQRMAEETLILLAKHQAERFDPERDAQPGKILHEQRVGELARLGAIPHRPHYGSVDSTILFIALVVEHARWTGSTALFERLRSNVERALAWIHERLEEHPNGFVAYSTSEGKPLENQGWKDSGDAISHLDGSLVRGAIALPEVQGYAYRALLGLAGLYDRVGEGVAAERLRARAEKLRADFEGAFWLDDLGYYALALENGGRPSRVLASNTGQVLWSGIASPERAARVAERLMSPELWTGFGIRTLTSAARRFNPVGYHLGTVWPHDNALIVAGLRRYGLDEAARRVTAGLVDAAGWFEHGRLPELFAGFDRSEFDVPLRYPVACHPQAWAAGAVPYSVVSLLGLEPEGFDRALRVVRPSLPQSVDRVELERVPVGGAYVSLRFARSGDRVDVQVTEARGVDVVVER